VRQGAPKHLLQITDQRDVVSKKTMVFKCVLFVALTQKPNQLLVYINHSVIPKYEAFDGDFVKNWGRKYCLIKSRR
jgi:hypothetical protein